jgi:hypothetical protein
MTREFIMRGQIESQKVEILNFGGHKRGAGFKLVEFIIYPATNMLSTNWELVGSLTADANVVPNPQSPDFRDEGLIGTAYSWGSGSQTEPRSYQSVVNDLFIITQDLTLVAQDSNSNPINWHCKFEAVKMSGPQEAATNYKQFTINSG